MAMKGLLHIPQSSKTGASPSDFLVSYPEHTLGGVGGVLLFCRDFVGIFYYPGWLAYQDYIFSL